MNFKIKKMNKLLIASILFGQLSSVFAQSILGSEDSFINLCTSYGIKKIPVSDQGVNNETQDVSQIMHCCLDVQSNFIFNKQYFIFERKTLFAFSDMNRNTIHGNNLNNHFLIRAPPSLVKN